VKKFISVVLSVAISATAILSGCSKIETSISELAGDDVEPNFSFVNSFDVDTTKTGKELTSLFNNINLWNVWAPGKDESYNIFEFTDYVQLMQCSGGTETRDLFKDPLDTSVLDDYDFTKLLNACQGILDTGAKPHLKLGSVPLKYSTNATNGTFSMNVYPPDDYDVYYKYIYALASALVEEFGKKEVLTWRFGVMTEFENKDWFMHPSGDPEKTKDAYCKLYDYTVQALIDAIGKKVFVGAHAMACSEGMWDYSEFIKHVAEGTNYANGKKGTRICYLASSWYHSQAGMPIYKTNLSFVETMTNLQKAANKYGLDDLIYGVDEGRILIGSKPGYEKFDLNTRVVGHTYQAAFDAKLYKQAMDTGVDYFSSWGFVTSGMPTMSYYIAKHTAEFEGMTRVKAVQTDTSSFNSETKALAAYDKDTKTLRIMAYNYEETLDDVTAKPLMFNIKMPQNDGKVKITTRYINDDCNYFDEWLEDRKTYNITDDMFKWSPDDPAISVFLDKADDQLKNTFYNEMLPKYKEAAKLTPKESTAEIKDGVLTVNDTIDGNSVVFYEIQF